MMRGKRLAAMLCSAALMLGAAPVMPAAQAAEIRETYTLVQRSPAEMRSFYRAHPWNFTDASAYSVQPSVQSPYAIGRLSDATQQNALNCMNFIRYAAGLPADLRINATFSEQAQAASLVNTLNNSQSHYPTHPAGLSDALYQLGYEGASHSNLCSSTAPLPNLPYTMMIYMSDTDSSNLSALGHRRWMLNPSMQQTGFGHISRYSAVYSVDMTRSGTFNGDYIAWPPPNMPYQLYDGYDYYRTGYAFSVTLGPSYDPPKLDAISVNLRSAKTGKTYHFDRSVQNMSGLYFNVDTQYIGIDNCIIFNPAVMFAQDDVLTVDISGTTKNGAASPISYQVRFFDLEGSSDGSLLTGDPDNSGSVTLDDALLTLQAYTATLLNRTHGLTAAQFAVADLDADKSVTLDDALIILQYYRDHSLLNKQTSWKQLGAKI